MTRQFPTPVASVFSRRVKPGFEDRYEAWLAGINEVSASFPGSQGTTVIRPQGDRREYNAVVQFDSAENLARWMESAERRTWVNQLADICLESEEIASLTGMERWFTLPDRSVSQAPPKWKSAFLVFLGLYPLALGLNPLLAPLIGDWPAPVRTLFTLSISVPLMVWVVMPRLTRLFFNWLYR